MWKLENIETGGQLNSSTQPEWAGGVWDCGDFRVTDPTGKAYSVTELPPAAPKVSPVEFKMLFTSVERVAIRTARTTDPTVDDFFDLVEDPRLTYVDLALPSVQGALHYLAAAQLIADARIPEILSGKVL